MQPSAENANRSLHLEYAYYKGTPQAEREADRLLVCNIEIGMSGALPPSSRMFLLPNKSKDYIFTFFLDVNVRCVVCEELLFISHCLIFRFFLDKNLCSRRQED
jgi:hypothetical protein